MEKTQRIMHFLVHELDGRLGRTQLVKLLYLIDLECRRYLGRQLSDLRYTFDAFGPFDPHFYDHKDSLVGCGAVVEQDLPTPNAVRHAFYRNQAMKPDLSALSPGERQVVQDVARRFGNLTREEIVAVAYATKPVQKSESREKGVEVPMSLVDNEGRVEIGYLDLDDVVRGHEEAQAGEVVSELDVERGLRARLQQAGRGAT
jgi:hypothetical protein